MRRVQAQIKEMQREGEEALQQRDDMAALLKESEKKVKNMETDLVQLQEDLAASERARRAAESERDELAEELGTSSSGRCVDTVLREKL